MNRRGQRGFSLIELGIVVAVIAILATVVLVGRGFLESSRVSKVVEVIDTIAKGTAVFAGSNGGEIPGGNVDYSGDLIDRELLKLGFDTSVPGFTISFVKSNPEEFTVTVQCTKNPVSCQDVCNAKHRDVSQINPPATCPATSPWTASFQI